jgi:hypothetical protein
METRAQSPQIEVKLSLKGQTKSMTVPTNISSSALYAVARDAFPTLANDARTKIKLILKGKMLGNGDEASQSQAFPLDIKPKPVPKIVIMLSLVEDVSELNSRRSDPLIRGFDNEKQIGVEAKNLIWGPNTAQHRHYKFVRLEQCSWQSFGHRPHSNTPHDYVALRLLQKLSTDPGIVAIMVERELVVNTLGEMDPIDDRLMQKKQQEGACLLGYNTNQGLRIDVKLRPDNLNGFIPYEKLVETLIHELSHNWVAKHDALFWANYGQMRVEYLHRHASLAAMGCYVNGRTTASLAGVADLCSGGLKVIRDSALKEVAREMAPHGIPLGAVAPAVVKRCEEFEAEGKTIDAAGQRLGGGDSSPSNGGEQGGNNARRELAFVAAERRQVAKAKKKDESKDQAKGR